MSDTKDKQAYERLCTARAHLLIFNPFFGMVLLKQKIREADWLSTMAVDGVHLYYNAEFVKKLRTDELEGVLTHEALHVIFAHPIRMANILKFNPPPPKEKQWDSYFSPSPEHTKCLIAADYTVNPILLKAQKTLPGIPISIKDLFACLFGKKPQSEKDTYLYDPTVENKTFEEIYSLLPQPPKQETITISLPDLDSILDGNGKGEGEGEGDSKGDGKQGDSNKNSNKSGGGNVAGSDKNKKNKSFNLQGSGGVLPHPSINSTSSSEEIDKAFLENKQMIIQIVEAIKNRGTLPAGLEGFIEDLTTSKVSWESLLKNFLEVSTKDDYTWKVPNRRYISSGVYLPSLNNKKLGTVVVAIDTSGSISDEMLTQFATEVCSILETTKPERVLVIYCDAVVGNVEEFTVDDFPLKFHVVGRGGTSFVPPFEYLKKNDITPVCMIYLTDGFGDWPDESPSFPLMWVIEPNGDKNFGCPFGDIVYMEND